MGSSAKGAKQWQTLTFAVKNTTGTHALWLLFYGKGSDLFAIDWLRFDWECDFIVRLSELELSRKTFILSETGIKSLDF